MYELQGTGALPAKSLSPWELAIEDTMPCTNVGITRLWSLSLRCANDASLDVPYFTERLLEARHHWDVAFRGPLSQGKLPTSFFSSVFPLRTAASLPMVQDWEILQDILIPTHILGYGIFLRIFPQHPAKSQNMATPTIFGQILTTPEQLQPITPEPIVISAAVNFP
ncbi:hypothetical protein B0H19DRAFT_1075644 [Mycena capillaripes]|nr:hypothetical protein B0H19DRAFT_1075644 [Mycena capillaripes]